MMRSVISYLALGVAWFLLDKLLWILSPVAGAWGLVFAFGWLAIGLLAVVCAWLAYDHRELLFRRPAVTRAVVVVCAVALSALFMNRMGADLPSHPVPFLITAGLLGYMGWQMFDFTIGRLDRQSASHQS